MNKRTFNLIPTLNPWEGYIRGQPDSYQINTVASREAIDLLKQVCPLHGVIQTTTNALLAAFIDRLTQETKENDPRIYVEQLTATLKLIRGCPTSNPARNSGDGDDGRPA